MSHLLETVGLAPFRQRFPWLGPDLQTLRDTLRAPPLLPETGQTLEFALPDRDRLLARLDPPSSGLPRALLIVLHGLGGGSDDWGQRRLSHALSGEGFAVLRLNLRGAGPGRPLARGTYSADCSADLLPVFRACRQLARELAPQGGVLPLGAAGLSLGGTVLLNALLSDEAAELPPLDGLVCISSPLDLARCSACFDRLRNRLYQHWMVRRLIAQTLADPLPLRPRERLGLTGGDSPRTLRAFDAMVTAPRLGFADVDAYYEACSPLPGLRQRLQGLLRREGRILPPLLLLHARDDPWVPADATLALAAEISSCQGQAAGVPPSCWPQVVITAGGGHGGFHAMGDTPGSRWSDRLVARWFSQVVFGNREDPPDPSALYGPAPTGS